MQTHVIHRTLHTQASLVQYMGINLGSPHISPPSESISSPRKAQAKGFDCLKRNAYYFTGKTHQMTLADY